MCLTTFENRVVQRLFGVGLLRALIVAIFASACSWTSAQSVVFINPGKKDESFWVTASNVIEQAADSLGMRLTTIFTERDRLRPIEVAKELAQLPQSERPDYLLFSNEYSVAPSILRVLEGSGIKAFMVYSGPYGELRNQLGKPREKFPFWLGSLGVQAEDAGYLSAKSLIAIARNSGVRKGASGKLHMVAISGDRSTTSSIQRNEGMRRAVREADDVVLEQEVYGEWRRDKAQEQANVLFDRYPDVRIVWSGNDLMAFGAMQAWAQRGGAPGKDAFFSGINSSDEAFIALREGRLSALAGGHFMIGAWAMVMLFDHSKGIDFLAEGLEREHKSFILFDAQSASNFQRRFNLQQRSLDFKPFSKFHNSNVRHYDFNLDRLLK